MTLMEFFGCSFIAFGPPLALFLFTICRDSLRIIVLIASGFFWLLSLLLSAILWFAVVPLRDKLAFGLVFSVLFQELFRFLFYKILRRADDGLWMVSQTGSSNAVPAKDLTNKHIMSYVSGLGFGVLSGAFSLINVLADMTGPGTIGIHGDSKYFFVTSACLTLCFILLHTFWGILFFYALDVKRYLWIPFVVLSHMLVSCLTLLNQNQDENGQSKPLYLATLLPVYAIMLVTGGITFKVVGGSLRNLKTAVTCKVQRYEID